MKHLANCFIKCLQREKQINVLNVVVLHTILKQLQIKGLVANVAAIAQKTAKGENNANK